MKKFIFSPEVQIFNLDNIHEISFIRKEFRDVYDISVGKGYIPNDIEDTLDERDLLNHKWNPFGLRYVEPNQYALMVISHNVNRYGLQWIKPCDDWEILKDDNDYTFAVKKLDKEMTFKEVPNSITEERNFRKERWKNYRKV